MKTADFRLVGLTGPTGAGKTTVAAVLSGRGIPIVDADEVTRAVQRAGSPCVTALADAFGADIVNLDGTLNRAALAARAFANPDNTAKLNAVTHPFILDEMHRRIDAVRAAGANVAVLDAPLLFEAHLDRICNFSIAVLGSKALRQARICARDGLDRAEADRRMAAQPDDAFYRGRADVVILNDGDLDALYGQVDALFTGGWL